VAQVHGGTDILVDLEVAGNEGKSGHVVPRLPGSGIGLGVVDGVVAHLGEGTLESIEFLVRQLGDIDIFAEGCLLESGRELVTGSGFVGVKGEGIIIF
jgi:hypothetical protein